jgi:hypothetical protein
MRCGFSKALDGRNSGAKLRIFQVLGTKQGAMARHVGMDKGRSIVLLREGTIAYIAFI